MPGRRGAPEGGGRKYRVCRGSWPSRRCRPCAPPGRRQGPGRRSVLSLSHDARERFRARRIRGAGVRGVLVAERVHFKVYAGRVNSGAECGNARRIEGGDQAAARQEALETRARSTWRRRVRSSRIFMPSMVTAADDDRQEEPDRSRIADHRISRRGVRETSERVGNRRAFRIRANGKAGMRQGRRARSVAPRHPSNCGCLVPCRARPCVTGSGQRDRRPERGHPGRIPARTPRGHR